MWWETTFTMPRMGIASSRPLPPEPTRKSNAIHTDTVFIFAIWMGIEVTMNTTITDTNAVDSIPNVKRNTGDGCRDVTV